MIEKYKKQDGFTGVDATIGVIIALLFSGLIFTISHNILLTSMSMKKSSKALNYIVKIFEYIDQNYYDDVTTENLENFINQTNQDSTQHTISFNINYSDLTEEEIQNDLVKQIAVKVQYKVGSRDEELEIAKTKARENLITPNAPNTNMLQIQEGQSIIPIKKVNNNWVVTNISDTTWYNYENGIWPIAIITSSQIETGPTIDISELDKENIYYWVPKYAYNSITNTIKFLYQSTSKYIQDNKLCEIDEDYTIPEGISGSGIWVNENDDKYITLESSLQYGRKNAI